MPTTPVLPKLVGQRVKRREDPRLIQGRGTYVDDIALGRHAAHRLQAQRRGPRTHRLHRYECGGGDGRGRGCFYRRANRRTVAADADRHSISFAGASSGCSRHCPVWGRTGRRGCGKRSVRGPRRGRGDRGDVRHAAGGRRPRNRDDGQADARACRLSEQPCRGAGAERHRRERVGSGGRFRHRRGVQEGRSRHLAADGEPAPRTVGDGAERRGRPLRTGQGHDDDLVVDAEPAHSADVHRGAERTGPGPGPRHRSGSGRRLRREDQHLRRRVRRLRRSRNVWAFR